MKKRKGKLGHRRISDYELTLNDNTALGKYTHIPFYVDVKEVLAGGCDGPIDLRGIVIGRRERVSAKSGKAGFKMFLRDVETPGYIVPFRKRSGGRPDFLPNSVGKCKRKEKREGWERGRQWEGEGKG